MSHQKNKKLQIKRGIAAMACLAAFVLVSLGVLWGMDALVGYGGSGTIDGNSLGQASGTHTPSAVQGEGESAEATEPFYLLLIGSDSRKGTALYTGRSGEHGQLDQHSDIMTLVRIDAQNATITLVTVPRDTQMPGGTGKINDALLNNNPEEVVSAVERLTGVDVSGYIMTDFASFPTFIDDLGGVTVDVAQDVTVSNPSTGKDITVKAGKNKTLSGDEALALSRGRKMYKTDQDAYRQLNVRNIEEAIIKKVLDAGSLEAVNAVVDYLKESCSSNLDYAALVPVAMQFAANDAQLTIYSCTGPYAGDYRESDGLWLCYENKEAWQQLMAAVDAGEDPTGIVEAVSF